MNQFNRNKLINLIFITVTCVVVAICAVIGLSTRHNNSVEPNTLANLESVTPESEIASETIPESTSVSELSTAATTFSSDEETYNYVVTMINERKYYSAIKYLRMIPGYKDADALQTKVFNLMNTDYFEFSEEAGKVIACAGMNASALASDKVVTRADSSFTNEKIVQRGAYWYLDNDGVFHTVGISQSSSLYKYVFAPILNYNRTVKFEKIFFKYSLQENSTGSYGVIITKEQSVSYFSIDPNNKWGPLELFGTYKPDWMKEGEKIIYVSSDYALSNKGNLLMCPTYFDNYYDSNYITYPAIDAANLVAAEHSNDGPFLLSDDGTVSFGYSTNFVYNEDYYPALHQWSDIIAIDSGWNYCCGLTSDGNVLLALKGVSNSLTPFSTDEVIVAITCCDNYVAALTEKGTVYTYTVPDMDKLTN